MRWAIVVGPGGLSRQTGCRFTRRHVCGTAVCYTVAHSSDSVVTWTMAELTFDSSGTGPTFGQLLRAHRTTRQLTQAALAAQAGCSPEVLRKFEADAKRPSRRL